MKIRFVIIVLENAMQKIDQNNGQGIAKSQKRKKGERIWVSTKRNREQDERYENNVYTELSF